MIGADINDIVFPCRVFEVNADGRLWEVPGKHTPDGPFGAPPAPQAGPVYDDASTGGSEGLAHEEGDYRGTERAPGPERLRLRELSASLDPETRRHILALGLAPGWRCLEVGAAEGSMSAWLSAQVGETGHVVAADLDLRFLADLDLPNLEVRGLDIRHDEVEHAAFDLAYCRTLLLHLPDPAAALRKLANALRPDGWLLVEEPDMCVFAAADPDHPRAEFFERFHRDIYQHFRAVKRMDTRFARTLPALFTKLGLKELRCHANARWLRGASPETRSPLRSLTMLSPPLLEAAVVTQAEIDEVLSLYENPDFGILSGLQVVVCGRKPGGAARGEDVRR